MIAVASRVEARPGARRPIGDLLVSLAAWAFYATCQGDAVLPAIAAMVVVIGLFRRRSRPDPPRIPAFVWWLALPVSVAVGWSWRAFVIPVPDGVVGGAVIGAFAPAAIIVGVPLVLLGHRTALVFAWLATAWAANAPIESSFLLALAIFAAVNLGVLAAGWRVRGEHRQASRATRAMAGFTVAWALCAVVVLAGHDLADGFAIESLERFIESFGFRIPSRADGEIVVVGGRDPGGRDVRAVLEVTPPGGGAVYLRTRVFELYRDDTWRAAGIGERRRLGSELGDDGRWRLFLLRTFRRALPMPAGVRAISSVADVDGSDLVRPVGSPPGPVVLFAAGAPPSRRLTDEERVLLTTVPEDLRADLESALVGVGAPVDEAPTELAGRLDRYFEDEYDYSLDPGLPRGNEGIRLFLAENRPAYCVHFATATAFLLRQRGIPARLVGGFIGTEREGNRLVVRVRDAHAWVELFVPAPEGEGGDWLAVDPTPAAARLDAVAGVAGADRLFDRAKRAARRGIERFRSTPSIVWLALALLLGVVLAAVVHRRRSPRESSDVGAKAAPHPLLPFYRRFEASVGVLVGVSDRQAETDDELLGRLADADELPGDVLSLASSFLGAYRGARFRSGTGRDEGLGERLEALERELGSGR